jgi:hypothetical protein
MFRRRDFANDSYLDDLVTGKFELWNICCVTCHEVSVEDAKYRFVGND